MDHIVLRHQKLEQALATLEESIALSASSDHYPEKVLLALRDSKIQRFEYSVDLFWKVLREYIELQGGKNVTIASPKFVLREALSDNILSQEEFDICIAMIDDRNKTSHIYDEVTAQEIDVHINKYYVLLDELCRRIKKKT